MTTVEKHQTLEQIFTLTGRLLAVCLFGDETPCGDNSDIKSDDCGNLVVKDAKSNEMVAEDPDMWLSVSDLIRLDALQKRSSNGELRQMSRQEFADFRADPATKFPKPAQINGHRKYWQLHQIDEWIDDDSKMSVDQFIAQRRVGAA